MLLATGSRIRAATRSGNRSNAAATAAASLNGQRIVFLDRARGDPGLLGKPSVVAADPA